MNKFIISVIIPVYNTEKYLEETIQSVVNQSLDFKKNIQLILINDGSKDKSEEICKKILTELDISATIVDGKGAYTGNARTVIMCAVKNYVFPRLRDVIKDADPQAFTIVTSAQEIYGEGYKEHGGEEL